MTDMRAIIYLFLIIISSASVFKVIGSEDEYDTNEPEEDDVEEDEGEPKTLETRDSVAEPINDFVGSNLFAVAACDKKCFSNEDVALLTTRKEFENLLPKKLNKCLLDDPAIEVVLQYFYCANKIIRKMTPSRAKTFAERAFYDTIGGYLNHYLVPVAKLSFYAGMATLKTTRNVFELLDKCKIYLNTNGNGWSRPISDLTEFDLTAESLRIRGDDSNENENQRVACMNLNLADERSENDEDMIVSLPKIDPEEMGYLGNIWLPFKRRHSFNLRSHLSAFILMRYFVSVTKCYCFQGVAQETFNRKFRVWLQEHIEPHLSDDILYPGLGAVLRVLETVRHNNQRAPKPDEFLPQKSILRAERHHAATDDPFSPIMKPTSSPQFENIKIESTKHKGPTEQSKYTKIFNKDDTEDYADDDSDSVATKRQNYIIAAIIIAIILFIFVVIVAIVTKRKEKKKHHKKCDRKPPHRFVKYLCFCFYRKKDKDDKFVCTSDSSTAMRFNPDEDEKSKCCGVCRKKSPSRNTYKSRKEAQQQQSGEWISKNMHKGYSTTSIDSPPRTFTTFGKQKNAPSTHPTRGQPSQSTKPTPQSQDVRTSQLEKNKPTEPQKAKFSITKKTKSLDSPNPKVPTTKPKPEKGRRQRANSFDSPGTSVPPSPKSKKGDNKKVTTSWETID